MLLWKPKPKVWSKCKTHNRNSAYKTQQTPTINQVSLVMNLIEENSVYNDENKKNGVL